MKSGDGRSEGEYAAVKRKIENDGRVAGGEEADEQTAGPLCEQDTQRRAQRGKQQAFGEQLADQAGAAGSDRHADGDFLATDGGAGDQEIGDIGASDEQHHADDDHQRVESGLVLAADGGISIGAGDEIKPPVQVVFLSVGWIIGRQCRGKDLRSKRIQARQGLSPSDTRFCPRKNPYPPVGALIERGVFTIERCFGAKRHIDLNRFTDLDAVKSARDDADDSNRMAVQCQPAFEDIGRARHIPSAKSRS